MKFIKTLLIVLVIVVIGGIVYVIMQPDDYKVSRSRVIDVPVEIAFNTVNDLKTYEDWGPWHEEDSTIVVSYGKKTTGLGARNSWTSADGNGEMWITEVKANELIHQKMRFEDYEPGDIIWNFESMQDSTKVTWTMKSKKAPFFFKMAAVYSGGWENMFAPMQEKGLKNLDELVLKQKQENMSFSFTDPKVVDTDSGTFVGYKTTSIINNEEMTKAFYKYMPMVSENVMASGYSYEEFIPGSVYYSWDEEKNETEFLVGVFLKSTDKLEQGDMEVFDIQTEKAVMSSKFGNYGSGDKEAHIAIGKYINSNNLQLVFPIYELYVNDPDKVKPKDIQTDIYYPIAE